MGTSLTSRAIIGSYKARIFDGCAGEHENGDEENQFFHFDFLCNVCYNFNQETRRRRVK